MIMNANMALTSLQSVKKYDFWSLPSNYLSMNALQVPVPSEFQTLVRLLHATTKRTSNMAVMVKKISPSQMMGRRVTPAQMVRTHAMISAAVTLDGTPCSSLERPLLNAAAKPIMGRGKRSGRYADPGGRSSGRPHR